MNGDTVIAKILKAEGVDWISCFPAQTLIDASSREGIRPIICRQERAGVNIADGFSRIKNGKTVGVFTMQQGPGSENAFAGVAQAYADSVPVLLLPGGHSRDRVGVHPNFDAHRNYTGVTKWVGHVSVVSRIPEMMRMAFSQLKHGRPGPVLLEIPEDIGSEEFPGESINYEPVKPLLSSANPDDVKELVTALLKASNPMINAGQGILYAEATDELVEFSELTNIPVMTTMAGKSAFPETHKLSLGTGAISATSMVDHFLRKTDFILGIGTSFTVSTFGAPMPKGATLAQSTNCAEDLNKDYGVSFGAVGDAKLVLKQLIEEVKSQIGSDGRSDSGGVAEEIHKIKGAWMCEWWPRLNSDEVPISPYRVFNELSKAVDVANTIITHDSGYPREQLLPFWQAVTPRSYIGWGKSTQLGYGLGLAIGAKLAAPDKQVINVMGDAAFGMAAMDIETAARAEIPILTVVLNNGVMTGYSGYMPYSSDQWGSNKLSGNYTKVAEGLGAHSERVTSPDELGSAINRAIKANQNGQTALVEVMTKEETTLSKYW